MSSPNELRLFISSTFRDLQEEREHLVKKVFPAIRSLCRSRGVTFTEVDLRWGLTEEDAMLGQVIRTCLEEIDKCRPYFIGMIGERYGWVPELHEVMRDPELLVRYPWIEDATLDGASVTEMEFIHGVFDAPSVAKENACFYHRIGSDNDVDDPERLDDLVDKVRASDRPMREFRDLEELGRCVERDLIRMIDRHWPENESPSPLELERRAHAAFAASRTRAYIPDRSALKVFTEWSRSGTTPLVIEGDSGLGKSSLVAYLSAMYRRRNRTACVIEHYIGASDGSGSAVATMRHVLEELRDQFAIEDELPQTEPDLVRAFPNWLFRAEQLAKDAEVPILIVIDAVNQLGAAGRRLAWLPKTVPDGVRLLISTTPGESADVLKERPWERLEVTPLEDEGVRQTIVVRYLGEFSKGVSPDQLRRLAADPKGASPLFLRVVAEELRLHGRHETIDDQIDRFTSASDLLGLFVLMLQRMERDYGTDEVATLLSLIGVSRSGLSETELLELSGMNRLTLSRLLSALDYHLIRKDGLLGFFHDYLRRAVERRYLGDPASKREQQLRVAQYFEKAERDPRNAQEMLWQYAGAGADDRMVATLGDLRTLHVLYRDEMIDEVLTHWSRLRKDGFDIEEIYRPSLPADPSGEVERAEVVDELLTAGFMLRRLVVWDLALEFCKEVVRLAEVPEQNGELASAWVEIGSVQTQWGQYDEATTSLEQAAELHRKLGNRAGQGAVELAIGRINARRGEYESALENFRKSCDIFRELGDHRRVAIATGNIGNVLFRTGESRRGLELLLQSKESARELGDRAGIALACGNIGIVYRSLGQYDEAIACYRQKIAIDEELGELAGVAGGLGNLGNVYYSMGELDRALEHYRRFAAITQEIGDRQGHSTALGSIGVVEHRLGQFDKARASLEEYLRISEELQNRVGIVIAIGGLGSIHLETGCYEKAMECFRRQITEAEVIGDVDGVARAWVNIATIHLRRGELETGLRIALDAVERQQELGSRYAVADTLEVIVTTVLMLLDNEEQMPDYLPELFDELTTKSWRPALLGIARARAEEARSISTDLAKSEQVFNASVLLARIDEAGGNREDAGSALLGLLAEADTDDDKAACHYWLWQFDPTANEEHRAEALRLYLAITERNRAQELLERIDELRSEPGD